MYIVTHLANSLKELNSHFRKYKYKDLDLTLRNVHILRTEGIVKATPGEKTAR